MNLQQVLELISAGENSSVEFKSAAVRNESLAKEIVAFANTLGGTIFIGVEDDGTITGCDSAFNYEEWCMNIARTCVIPSVTPLYEEIALENKRIIILTICKGKDKPYQTGNTYLVRVGTTNRTATQSELMRLFQQAGFFHYDIVGLDGTSERSLNYNLLDTFFSQYDFPFAEESDSQKVQLLKNIDVLTDEGTATVAGVLLFASNPQRTLINASISVARFNGNEICDQLGDLKVIEGVLPYQVDTASKMVQTLIPVASSIEGNKRVDMPHLSERFFRELIVNAVVHRTYAIAGSRIRIFIFDNRLEIRSPGRLPNTITVEKMVSGVSYAINPVIVKFMENLRYIDKIGRGIPMVCAEARKLGVSVTFEESGEEFVVTVYYAEKIRSTVHE